jgi:hypothetical protein
MKNSLFSLFLLSASFLAAQMGVNVPEPKAVLHLEATHAETPEQEVGFGIPVVHTFSADTPTENQNGMLVYVDQSTESSLEGYYFWNESTQNWELIVDYKSNTLDFSKVIAKGNSFFPNNIIGLGPGSTGVTETRMVPFTSILTLNPSFVIDGDGGLVVGKAGQYHLNFAGVVVKTAQDNVHSYKTEILINGIATPALTSSNNSPGGASQPRYSNFSISSILDLEQGDIITMRLTKEPTNNDSTIVSVFSPYTIVLTNLN